MTADDERVSGGGPVRPSPLVAENGDSKPRIATGRLRLRRDVAALCRVVEEGDFISAGHAAGFLGDIGDPAAVDTLLRCLDGRGEARGLALSAARALGRMREPRAVPGLIDLLARESGDARDDVVWALADLGDPAAVPHLLDVAGEQEWFGTVPSGDQALRALARFEPDVVVPALLARLWEYMGDLLHGGVQRPGIAAEVLGDLGSHQALPALAYLVGHFGVPVRRQAALALTRLRNPEDLGVQQLGFRGIETGLGDPDPWTSTAVAEFCARTELGQKWLLRAVQYGGRAQEAACHGLGATGETRHVPPLLDALSRSQAAVVRRAAATALGVIGGPEAAAALLTALGDAPVQDAVTRALADTGAAPVAGLMELLADGSPDQRRGAALTLGMTGAAEAGPRLVMALSAGEPAGVRAAAARALGDLRYESAVPALLEIAQDPDESGRLRAQAVRALGRFAVPEAEPVLLRAVRDSSEDVRRRAAEALGAFPGGAGAVALVGLVDRGDTREVQRAALESLVRMGEPAREDLFPLVHRVSDEARAWVAEQLKDGALVADIPALTPLACDNDPAVSLPAIEALAGLRHPRAVDALVRVLDGPHTRWRGEPSHQAALEALAHIDDERAVAAVVEHATYVRCHRAAREALNTIAARGAPAARHRRRPERGAGECAAYGSID